MLLYSSVREQSNKKKTQAMRRQALRTANRYRRQCKAAKKTPNQGESDRIVREEMHKVRLVLVRPRDTRKINAYAHKILSVWALMGALPYGRKNKSHLRFDEHVLGSLYLVQYGWMIDSTEIFAADTFLWTMLPPIQDLPHYGFRKKLITIGKNHIYRCFKDDLAHVSHKALKALAMCTWVEDIDTKPVK